jgi:hypothetical protein
MIGMSAAQAKKEPPKREPRVPIAPETEGEELEWWSLADVFGSNRVGRHMGRIQIMPIELIF